MRPRLTGPVRHGPGTRLRFGKVCSRHPELKGERRAADSSCPLCSRDKSRQRSRLRPEYNKAANAKWRSNNPALSATYRRRGNWRFQGICPDKAGDLLDAHDGRCEICLTQTPVKGQWCVDHDHETKMVRGILCRNCNVVLGLMKDDPAALTRAAEYLRKHK